MVWDGNHTTRILHQLLDGVVLILAAWTVYCYVLGLLGADYRLLFALAFLPFAPALWILFFRFPKHAGEPVVESRRYPIALPQLFVAGAAAIGVAGVYMLTGSYVAFWTLACVVLLSACRMQIRTATAAEVSMPPERTGIVVLLCLAALTVTLAAHRPDADDSFYLSLVVGAQDHPEQPILRFDDMYGEPDLPLIESAYRLKSYELLIASLSHWLTVPPKALYYLFFPSLFAILAVVAHWLTLREIGGPYAWLGAAVSILVLVVWGDGEATFGNFAFVRLFQGKAVLVSVFVPAAVLYASRFARERSWRNWLFLAAVQTAALGFSPSAVAIAPLAVAAYLLAAAPESRGSKLIREGLLASTLVVVAGGLAFAAMPIEGNVPATPGAVWELLGRTGAGLEAVLGNPARRSFALFALLFVPLLCSRGRRDRILGRYVLILMLVVMNPLLSAVLGIVTERLTWRVFWAVPFPLVLGLLAQRLASSRPKQRSPAWVGGAMVGVLFALTPGPWTVSETNESRLGFPGYKVDPGHAVARSIVEQTSPQDLVLAPIEVAQWVPTFSQHPRLVAVRQNYLYVFDIMGWDEVRKRRLLMRLVTYDWFPLRRVKAAVEVIKRRGVSLVVVPTRLPQRDTLTTQLEGMGCRPSALSCSEGFRSYEAWRCPGR